MLENYSAKEIEAKWQKIWEDMAVFQPEPDQRKKFFLTIPYPYLNGNLHAGHTRTFTIGDTVARFRRMRGDNVLFPMLDGLLGRKKQMKLVEGFEDLERKKIGVGVHEEFHKLLHELKEIYLD